MFVVVVALSPAPPLSPLPFRGTSSAQCVGHLWVTGMIPSVLLTGFGLYFPNRNPGS